MKKLLALMMALMLVLMTATAFAAESEFREFELTNTKMLMDTFGLEPGGWYSTGVYRAMLTFFVAADFATATGANTDDVHIEESYVAYNEENDFYIVAFGYQDSCIVTLLCIDLDSYSYVDGQGVPMTVILDGVEGFVYEKNTTADLDRVIELIQNSL